MEFRGLLRLARLLLFPELARDIAERQLLRYRLSVNGFRGFFCSGGRLAPLFGFYARAIFQSQDAGTAQVFFSVNVLGWPPLIFFTRALLAGCFSNILSLAIRYAEKSARKKQNGERREAMAMQQIPKTCEARPRRVGILEVRYRRSHQLRELFATHSIVGCTGVNENRAGVPFGYAPRSTAAIPHFWLGATKEPGLL
jgi:hypothetical protein